jgi:hypothetical protein
MAYLSTLLKFIVGGSVIVGVTLLAGHADPRYGGMLRRNADHHDSRVPLNGF